ncbi:hypothetical protein DL98DRAFT_523252 [Cadophora sp. DSE1049]|nr:hypothetical protein DL98DRAFT_523252 [Cadophora sp. DSE1049]
MSLSGHCAFNKRKTSTSGAHPPDKLPIPDLRLLRLQGAGEMEEEILFVDDMPTAADGSGRRRAGEDELGDRAC